MEELKILLENVEDSYDDFVKGMLKAIKIDGKEKEALRFLKEHPNAKTDEIIEELVG